MKKTTIFRKMAITAMFVIASVGTFAQYVVQQGTYDASLITSDYVTIGSTMPYYVAPDASIQALIGLGAMTFSQFEWQMTTMGSVSLGITPLTYAGGALTTLAAPNGAVGYFTQNEISVPWSSPQVAVGTEYEVQVQEHSVPASGIFAEGCPGTTTVRDIFVIAAPTITIPVAQNAMACGSIPAAGLTFYVPVTVTGIGPWTVTYSVTYNGAPYLAAAPNSVGVAPGETDATVFAVASTPTVLAGTPTAATAGLPVVINGGGATNGYGMYVVTVTNITDEISRKSLDAIPGTLVSTTYTIYVNPTPATNPIQHEINN